MTHGTSFDFNGDLPMGMPITFGVQNAEHESKDGPNSRFILFDRRQPAGDAHPRRALHPRRRRARRATGRRRSTFLHGRKGGRLGADQARHRRGVRPRALSPDRGRRRGGLGLHAHVHGRAAARAHRHRQAAACATSWPRGRPGTRARPPASASASTEGARRRWVRAAGDDLWTRWRTACRRCPTSATSAGTRRAARRWSWDRPPRRPGRRAKPPWTGEYMVRLARRLARAGHPGLRARARGDRRGRRDRAAEVTGVPAETIVRVARGYAAERPAAVIMGGGSNHWFHGDLTGRAFALLASLTGDVGRSGGGFSVYVATTRSASTPLPGGRSARSRPRSSQRLLRAPADRDHE